MMNVVNKSDFSVWPMWLTAGRPMTEQTVLAHLFRYQLTGEVPTYAKLASDCGTTGQTVKKVLVKLVADGVIVAEGKWFAIASDHVPERPVVIPKAAKPKKTASFPPWVKQVSDMWYDERRVFVTHPQVMRKLKPYIAAEGEDAVLTAIEYVAAESMKAFQFCDDDLVAALPARDAGPAAASY